MLVIKHGIIGGLRLTDYCAYDAAETFQACFTRGIKGHERTALAYIKPV